MSGMTWDNKSYTIIRTEPRDEETMWVYCVDEEGKEVERAIGRYADFRGDYYSCASEGA